MPELGPEKNFSSEINKIKNSEEGSRGYYGEISKGWKDVADKYNKIFFGSGIECVVLGEKADDKVFAISRYYKTPEEAKKIFYSHQILQTLFPYNFPHMYASFAPKEDDLSHLPGTIRRKISGKREDEQSLSKQAVSALLSISLIRNIFTRKYKHLNVNNHSFASAHKALDQLIPFINFDENVRNFITDDVGHEYYVDTAIFISMPEKYRNRILEYMKKNNYSDADIGIVSNAIKRLRSTSG